MRYYINNPVCGITKETEQPCTCDEDVLEILDDDFMEAFINVAFETVEVQPKGCFIEKQVEEYVYSTVENYLRKKENELLFFSITRDDNGNEITRQPISLLDKALEWLDDDRSDCQSNCRVCCYIESCLYEFSVNGEWHIGVRDRASNKIIDYTPNPEAIRQDDDLVLWFGIQGQQPHCPWLIDKDTKDLSFWFEIDSWTFMEAITDCDDITLTWYTDELQAWLSRYEQERTIPLRYFSND